LSKYGSALGCWDLEVGRTKDMGALKLHPTHKDNRELLEIVMDERIKTNPKLLLDKIGEFVKKLISKDYPPENDQEKLDLEEYIGFNLLELMNETLITFKLAKREDLELAKKELLQIKTQQ